MSIDLDELDKFTSYTVNVGAAISPLTLNLPAWCEAFGSDIDAPFLIGGCAYGFNWEKTPPEGRFVNRNHVEEEYSAQVDAKIRGMVAKGELVRAHPSAIHCVSGILAIPKDAGDDVRVCHNLAAPYGDSVNDNQWVPSMRFISVTDALALHARRRLDVQSGHKRGVQAHGVPPFFLAPPRPAVAIRER